MWHRLVVVAIAVMLVVINEECLRGGGARLINASVD